MKIYISGPMTGIKDHNFPAFNQAARLIAESGHTPVNPADGGADPAKTWTDYLREDLRLLLDCDAVATLPGWTASRGASLEVYVAKQLGIPVQHLSHWLDQGRGRRRGACVVIRRLLEALGAWLDPAEADFGDDVCPVCKTKTCTKEIR